MGQGSPSTWRYTADGIVEENGDLVCDASDPFDCTHLECNVSKPKRKTDPAVWQPGPVDMLRAVDELAARWHRTQADDDLFNAGRREGYVQAIALLLDEPHAGVLAALRAGRL